MGILKKVKNQIQIYSSTLSWIKEGKPTINPAIPFVYFVNKINKANKLKQIEELRTIYPNVLTKADTINYALQNKCSIARLGDVELEMAINSHSTGWENPYWPKLGKKMREILKNGSSNNTLVCINCIPNENDYGFIHMSYYYLTRFHYKKIGEFFNIQNIYGDALAFRITSLDDSEKIKKLWEGKKVLFVVGKDGLFEVENELFNNTLEKAFIYGPATDAFSEYDRILSDCLKYDKDWLIYLALGATATILACELSQKGYQALDFGKLDVSYRFMKEGKDIKNGIPPKGGNTT